MRTRHLIWPLAALWMGLLGACSKTVTWEEEVPLNTGEVIWVKRSINYKLKGASGNPLDIAYQPDWIEMLEFNWQGKTYSYTGDAGIMLLAISPITKFPVLVARADLKGWDRKNGYKCTNPFYVQFSPDKSGSTWIWPTTIESWLYESPYNLMHYRPSFSEGKSKYKLRDRLERDRIVTFQSPSLIRIDSQDAFDECKK